MDVVEVTRKFVSYNSASQLSNAAVSKAIARQMRQVGLKVERLEYRDKQGTVKVCLVGKKGRGAGGLALMGHSDVVPAEGWAFDPFKGLKKNGRLYGRGSADMKGSIACMLAAAERFSPGELKRPIYVVATSDEEIDCGGAAHVMKHSKTFKTSKIRYGIIGEPTLLDVVHAHKGSFRIHATAKGKAAHSSTGRGINANHTLIPFLNDMLKIDRDLQKSSRYRNEAFVPPHPTLNIVFSDGESASNITVPESRATINCRPMPGQNWDPVLNRVERLAQKHGVKVDIARSLVPLSTPTDSRIVREALRITGKRKPKTVAYGTDGMIFAKSMELVVLGPGNIAQAHTVDEWIALEQLHKGVDVFAEMLRRFCIEDPA